MKQFLYLDNDIVNSIIAQANKGIISEFSQETENSKQNRSSENVSGEIAGDMGASIFSFAKANINANLQDTFGSEKSLNSSYREIINKTLHDAAFDMAYNQIAPKVLDSGNNIDNDYGSYIEIKRVFDVVDFDYIEDICSEGGLMELMKKAEKEKIEETANGMVSELSRNQRRLKGSQIKAEMKKILVANSKQYDDIKDIISVMRQLIPYNRMLLSYDGYLIPLDDNYFRINPKNLGFKYGGEITCVGMITNIIGEDTNPNDSQNIFVSLQFYVNEALRLILPTNKKNLYVIHPIAVYYGE